MKLLVYILSFVFFFQQVNVVNAKEAENHMCFKEDLKSYFLIKKGIFKIKKETNISPDQKRAELNRFKTQFEKNFQGIPLYKEAGCSNARLSEYLECLISTDGKDCKIYYTQMRIVD